MKLHQIIALMNQIAPISLAEAWDKPGLHTGELSQSVSHALLCIDLTPAVVAQAIKEKAKLIVAYHPPIFEPLTTLAPTSWKTQALVSCIQNGIAVYSPHTSLDAAPDGLNHWLATGLGEGTSRPIKPISQPAQGKLTVFVPKTSAQSLRDILTSAGAGRFGNYSRCTFSTLGEGTFQGNKNSNPAIGRPGKLEYVEELRMEMIFPWYLHQKMADLIRTHHPYEEPAFDIFPLTQVSSLGEMAGQGRIVTLNKPASLKTLTQRITQWLGVKQLSVSLAAGAKVASTPIRTIGLCAGAGSSLLSEAGQIDAFFTGEMRYHDVLDANQRGVNILLAGHVETERPYLAIYRKKLAQATGRQVSWKVARA